MKILIPSSAIPSTIFNNLLETKLESRSFALTQKINFSNFLTKREKVVLSFYFDPQIRPLYGELQLFITFSYLNKQLLSHLPTFRPENKSNFKVTSQKLYYQHQGKVSGSKKRNEFLIIRVNLVQQESDSNFIEMNGGWVVRWKDTQNIQLFACSVLIIFCMGTL